LIQYEAVSNRLVPEAVAFVSNIIILLAPSKFSKTKDLPLLTFCPDFGTAIHRQMIVTDDGLRSLKPNEVNLANLLSGHDSDEQARINLLFVSIKLLRKFAEMYRDMDGFLELFQAAVTILQGSELKNSSSELQVCAIRLCRD
jgi:nucleolar protein 14